MKNISTTISNDMKVYAKLDEYNRMICNKVYSGIQKKLRFEISIDFIV